MKNLPEKTIERLSQYRRMLLKCHTDGKHFIYSHELASFHNITAVQVRRDLMLIGYSSTGKKGYDVEELIKLINNILDDAKPIHVAIVGIGNLGRAISIYFGNKRPKLKIVAAFDTDEKKVNKVFTGIRCYHVRDLQKIIREKDIEIAILTVPPEFALTTAEKLVMSGIKGILNFTAVPLNETPHAYIEEYDMLTSLEKIAYFVKYHKEGEN